MELRVGKLRKIDGIGTAESVEEFSKYISNEEHEISLDPYYKNWTEYFQDKFYKKYIIYKNEVYEILKNECFDGDDIFKAHYDEHKNIDFILNYYNGGCGFNEAIEEALGRLNNVR